MHRPGAGPSRLPGAGDNFKEWRRHMKGMSDDLAFSGESPDIAVFLETFLIGQSPDRFIVFECSFCTCDQVNLLRCLRRKFARYCTLVY